MGSIGLGELLVVLVVVLILFGAGRLPEMGRALGKGIREFKKEASGHSETDEQKPRGSTQ